MGGSSSKHYQLVDVAQSPLVLTSEVCDVAEDIAKAKCGKHALQVYQQCSVLRAVRSEWDESQHAASQLHGQLVYQVAAALQVLSAKLAWCKVCLQHFRPGVFESAQQQADKLQQVLLLAQEAHTNFQTSFRLALAASREQSSSGQPLASVSRLSSSHASESGRDAVVVRLSSFDRRTSYVEQGQQHAVPVAQGITANAKRSRASVSSSPGADLQHFFIRSSKGGVQNITTAHYGEEGTEANCAAGHVAADGTEPSSMLERMQSLAVQHHTSGLELNWNDAPAARPAIERRGDEGIGSTDKQQVEVQPADWKHTEQGWQELVSQAWQGDVASILAATVEFTLGGDFCTPDYALARQLLVLAVQQDCGAACHLLGLMAEKGLGLPAPDCEEAVAWFGAGAALGHVHSAHALAYALENGLGLSHDAAAAVQWYEYAASQGHVSAQNNLGRLLLTGADGVQPHTASALHWLQAAAAQGCTTAWYNMGVCFDEGVGDCAADVEAAEECYAHAAQQQHTGALMRLGQLQLVHGDAAAATGSLQSATCLESAEGMLQLAKLASKRVVQLQSHGRTRPASAPGVTARKSLVRRQDSLESLDRALERLTAPLTAHESALEVASGTAMRLYQQAAAAGSAEAQHVVGCSLWHAGDVDGALELWHRAAARGHIDALLSLAAAAETGQGGVVIDSAAAAACYQLAAAAGSADAARWLEAAQHEAAVRSMQRTVAMLSGSPASG